MTKEGIAQYIIAGETNTLENMLAKERTASVQDQEPTQRRNRSNALLASKPVVKGDKLQEY
jgi:hypothetical protein